MEDFGSEGDIEHQDLYVSYYLTRLKASSSYDVLREIHRPKYELLSQSKSVVASWGQNKNGHKKWFNMVAFDENEMTAKRKYIFIVDDRPNIMQQSRKDASFDCKVVLDPEALDKPYADENSRRIAILREVHENFRKDIGEVASDNKMLNVCGMMVNQALEAALVKLDGSPALASRLSAAAGVDFSHINLGRGKIQMLGADVIVRVKMRLGRQVKL
jgi:hypothetical protein